MKLSRIAILFLVGFLVYLLLLDSNPSTMIFRVCICAICLYCFKKGSKESNLINPYYLFMVTPLSLLLYTDTFAPIYLNPLNMKTWLLATINILGFLLGYEMVRDRHKIVPIPFRNSRSARNVRRHIIVLGVLSVIPVLFRYLHISIPLRSFMGFFGYIGLAMAYKSQIRSNIILASLFILICFLEDFNKSRFLTFSLASLICYESYFVKTDYQKRKILFGILGVTIFMLLVAFPLKTYIRDGGSYIDFANQVSDVSESTFEYYDSKFNSSGPDFLKMPYMYLVSSWNNLQYVVQTQDSRTYGLWSLKPLLTYCGLSTQFENYYTLIPESTFNTFTYISVLFKDFGYWASVFGSLFLGAFVKLVKIRAIKNGSSFDIASYSLVCFATFQMYFSNHFFGMSYPFTIIIIGYVYKKLFKVDI